MSEKKLCMDCFKEWLHNGEPVPHLLELSCDTIFNEAIKCDRCGRETRCYIILKPLSDE